LLKKSAATELFQAIQDVLKGKPYVTPQIARGMEKSFIRNPRNINHARTLTSRQNEVVRLLAEGMSMKQAANVLKVTSRTVAFHKYRAMEELGLKTTADLIRFAFKQRSNVA
jgi:DNA-binding NarL/FixJ family response regulator